MPAQIGMAWNQNVQVGTGGDADGGPSCDVLHQHGSATDVAAERTERRTGECQRATGMGNGGCQFGNHTGQ